MPGSPKIKTLDQLAAILEQERLRGRRAVHCHGVFDLLHIGHIRYLQRARELVDLLVVTVTPDRFVNKGPHRPAFQESLRLDALAALDCVAFVAINPWPTAAAALRQLRPHVYAKGAEFRVQKTPELLAEEAVAAELGVEVRFIEEVTSSSSHLINKYMAPFDAVTEDYLRGLRQRETAEHILSWLDRAAERRVLVLGETIIDEYYACAAIGRSAKAPVLATRYESHQRFAGGAAAVANHLATLCGQVDLLSMLGEENSEEAWIRTQLARAVQPTFFFKSGSPTIVKRRYRESYFGVPLFAVNFFSEQPLSAQQEDQLVSMLADRLGTYDAVIVADYGHEMFAPRVVEVICDRARFLAVNTQANAANTGFHTISKYPRADYIALAERELQLECRSRVGDLREQLVAVGQRLYATTAAVTLGKRGCLCYHRRQGFHEAPALATTVVDRVGAGDAFFAITALAAALDAPLEVLAFLGNVAGAEAVAVVGNSRSIEADPLRRHVASLFK
jgi:rfaE bifunctional protein kinase chain/domain/rfaE bifunctional protein nucleotidyltransferase chain/domain